MWVRAWLPHGSPLTSAFPVAYSVPSDPLLQAWLSTRTENKTKPRVTAHSQRMKGTNFNFLTSLPTLFGSQLLLQIPGVDRNYFKEQSVFRSKLREKSKSSVVQILKKRGSAAKEGSSRA